jgi:acetyltransferase
METHPTIDGEVVTIRPIQITDAEMEAEFIRRLSPQTKHFRFVR